MQDDAETWARKQVESAFQRMSLGREMQVPMGDAIHAEREWLQDAKQGRSTSARSPLVNTPDLKTPLPYHDYGDVEELRTPTPVVNPMKKATLQAHARLQANLRHDRMAQKGVQSLQEPAQVQGAKRKAAADKPAGSMPCRPEMADVPKPAQDVTNKVDMGDAVMGKPLLAIKDKEPEVEDGKAVGKKKRRPNNGPMQAVLKSYMAAKKQEGVSYREAQKLWLTSEERAGVVSSLSASERSKRRF